MVESTCISFSAVNETRYSHTVAALHSTHQPSMATHILHLYSVVICAQALAEQQRGMMHGSRCHNHMYAKSRGRIHFLTFEIYRSDPPTLRLMMNGFDLMVRTTIDVKHWTYTMLFFGSPLGKVHK